MTNDVKGINNGFQASYKKMLLEEREAASTKYLADLRTGDKFKFKIDQKVFNTNVLHFLDSGNLEDEYPIHQLKWSKRVFNASNTVEKSNTDNFYAFINGVFTVKNIDKSAMTLETPPIYFPVIEGSNGDIAEVSSIDSVGAGLIILALPKDKIAVEIVKKSATPETTEEVPEKEAEEPEEAEEEKKKDDDEETEEKK
jgi:hypothetical protein